MAQRLSVGKRPAGSVRQNRIESQFNQFLQPALTGLLYVGTQVKKLSPQMAHGLGEEPDRYHWYDKRHSRDIYEILCKPREGRD